MADSLVTIATFWSAPDAELARGVLEAAGIEAVLADDEIVRVNRLYAGAVRGIKLRVRREEAMRAAEVLESESTPLEEIGEADEPVAEPETCRACGSLQVERRSRAQLFAMLVLLIVGVGVAIGSTDAAFLAIIIAGVLLLVLGRARCEECGESWN